MKTKEEAAKLFPEKDIGEVDDKEVFQGVDETNQNEQPNYHEPSFLLKEWLLHGDKQWRKEDTWAVFEEKGAKYDYTLLRPESVTQDPRILKSADRAWIVKRFENPSETCD
jgi:hypothetical protein